MHAASVDIHVPTEALPPLYARDNHEKEGLRDCGGGLVLIEYEALK